MENQKHRMDGKRRVCRKLHITVDTSAHEIIAAELSLSTVTDGKALPTLLKQTRRSIFEVSGNGAYEKRECHAAIKIKGIYPKRRGGTLGVRPRSKSRSRLLEVIQLK